jgi:hypothetical protein
MATVSNAGYSCTDSAKLSDPDSLNHITHQGSETSDFLISINKRKKLYLAQIQAAAGELHN